MTDFFTVFAAVFLAEIASIPVKRYFTPNAEKVLDKLDKFIKQEKSEKLSPEEKYDREGRG